MKAVYKYQMMGHTTVFDVPAGADVLSAELQGEEVMVWFLVDTETNAIEPRTFRAVATGEMLDTNEHLHFVSTVLVGNGVVVWHIFEVLAGVGW